MMNIEYSQDRKTALFDGHKFRRDMKTGYYLASKPTYNGKRERLHCYVWRHFNGPVKDGYIVHHKDGDKNNNDIDNLRCISAALHGKHHSCKRAIDMYDDVCRNLSENAVPKASEWHKSDKGRKWHKENWKISIGSIKPKELTCEYCGKTYTTIDHGTNRFCSNTCKTASRRKSGVDDETRICACCGKPFQANKYATKRFCSAECRNKIRQNKSRPASGQTAGI